MITYEEACSLIAGQILPLGEEVLPFAQTSGRVLAQDLVAQLDSPRCAVSAMDGYAVRNADMAGMGTRLAVVGESFAGTGHPGRIGAGEAMRIFTGAPLPAGADRVIIQENVDREGEVAIIARAFGAATNVRAQASDFAAGTLILAKGHRLGPRAMVAAAAADQAELLVASQPKVAIIATGDELAPPGSAHHIAGAIPESITPGIAAMVQSQGGCVLSTCICKDDLALLETHARQALAIADLVIIIGGASVGERDFSRAMFAKHEPGFLFSKLAMKPGKPVWLAKAGGRWVMGLPGNPTSAMVTARLLLMPALAALQGQSQPAVCQWHKLPLAKRLGATGDRETFARARWDCDGLTPLGNQDSGTQSPLAAADWLIRCPPDQAALEAGAMVLALEF